MILASNVIPSRSAGSSGTYSLNFAVIDSSTVFARPLVSHLCRLHGFQPALQGMGTRQPLDCVGVTAFYINRDLVSLLVEANKEI